MSVNVCVREQVSVIQGVYDGSSRSVTAITAMVLVTGSALRVCARKGGE